MNSRFWATPPICTRSGKGCYSVWARMPTSRGRISGTQVSIFDVSDLANPVRTHQFTLPESSRTEVEFNHRAFLYWPATGIAVLPVGWWGHRDESGRREPYQGAIVLGIGPEGIEELGTIEHELQQDDPEVDRSTYYWRYVPDPEVTRNRPGPLHPLGGRAQGDRTWHPCPRHPGRGFLSSRTATSIERWSVVIGQWSIVVSCPQSVYYYAS